MESWVHETKVLVPCTGLQVQLLEPSGSLLSCRHQFPALFRSLLFSNLLFTNWPKVLDVTQVTTEIQLFLSALPVDVLGVLCEDNSMHDQARMCGQHECCIPDSRSILLAGFHIQILVKGHHLYRTSSHLL